MMKTLDTTAKLFTPDKAEAVAKEMTAGDADWTYKARHGNGPFSLVDCFDENGELVATL